MILWSERNHDQASTACLQANTTRLISVYTIRHHDEDFARPALGLDTLGQGVSKGPTDLVLKYHPRGICTFPRLKYTSLLKQMSTFSMSQTEHSLSEGTGA